MLQNEEVKLTEEEAKVKEQVEDITTTTFSIQGVPMKVYSRFIKFCEENAQITKIFKDRTGQKQIKKELILYVLCLQMNWQKK